MRCLRYSVPYIAGKNQPKDSDPAPCGAGPLSHCSSSGAIQFQSTRPLRGGTAAVRSVSGLLDISIHPPLAGRDPLHRNALRPIRDFNPPAPCGAGRDMEDRDAMIANFNPPAPCGAGLDISLILWPFFVFQSTRPLRGGTSTSVYLAYKAEFQSTRPLRGGTPPKSRKIDTSKFQSTRPLRGGTRHKC